MPSSNERQRSNRPRRLPGQTEPLHLVLLAPHFDLLLPIQHDRSYNCGTDGAALLGVVPGIPVAASRLDDKRRVKCWVLPFQVSRRTGHIEIPSITAWIGNDARSAYPVIEGVVDMAVNPEIG